MYDEIYPPIIEKQKTIDPSERSVYQLLEQYVEGEKDNPLAYRAAAKAHAAMLQKIFSPMYSEHLAFVTKRAGWKVTKINSHLRFEQKPFKKKFILMNQKSRQNSKNNIEKDFYKLTIILILGATVGITLIIVSLFQYLVKLKKSHI